MPTSKAPQFTGLDDSHAALLVRLRDAVVPILGNNLFPHFTDHSVAHSDSLVKLVCDLTKPLEGQSNALNQDELVVLYSVCYLHDFGLQYELSHELGVIPEGEFSAPWADLSDQGKRVLMRRHHHRISAALVQLSARAATPPIGLQLTQDYNPAIVAALCEAHCLEDVDSEEYEKLTTDRANLRISLLSALLRVADILDESRRRACRSRAETLDLDLESLTHWWRIYYTESVSFDPRESQISVHFDFPPARRGEYARIIPELQFPVIEEELARHQKVLSKHGLPWHVVHDIKTEPYSTIEAMPDDVLVEMTRQLRHRRREQADLRRAADLQVFEEAQLVLQRQWEELQAQRDRLTPADYLRDLYALACNRWQLGAKRSACMTMLFDFGREACHLPPMERLAMGLELAAWLHTDDQSFSALGILQNVHDVAVSDEPDVSKRFQYWELWRLGGGSYRKARPLIRRNSCSACRS